MPATWLGCDRTIDLKAWAVALGVRHAYLNTLPGLCGTFYTIGLNADGSISEILAVTLDKWFLVLKHLPPDRFPTLRSATSDLNIKLASIRSHLPTKPPVLCAILLDEYAASQAALATAAGHRRGSAIKAQLLAERGAHWASWAVNASVQEMVISVLTGDLNRQMQRLARWLEGKTLIFHRGGLPETRRGVRFQDQCPYLLATSESVNAQSAIWIDERLVGRSLTLIDDWLKQPGQVDAKSIYRGLASLLRQRHLRHTPSKALRYFHWLPNMLGGAKVQKWLSLPSLSPTPPLSEKANLTLALYLSITEPALQTCSFQETDIRQRCSRFLDIVARHPTVRVTVGCSDRVLRALAREAPDVLNAIRERVADNQIEIAYSLAHSSPAPVLLRRDHPRRVGRKSGWQLAHPSRHCHVGRHAESGMEQHLGWKQLWLLGHSWNRDPPDV